MAQSRRVERVASLIRKEVSDLLLNSIRDERINKGIITITEVDLSGDLQHCKIFVSVFGSKVSQEDVIIGLHSATTFIRIELAKRLQMRRSPEILFYLDRGIEKGMNVLNLLGKLQEERNSKENILDNSKDQI